MGKVEEAMLSYLKGRLGAGALSVPAEEILNAVIPPEHLEYRLRPAYKHGLERLRRRGIINAWPDKEGTLHYYIGNYPSDELRNSLGC